MGTVLSSKQLRRSAPLPVDKPGLQLHLSFLYLPPAPPTTTDKTDKPEYLSLSLGTQADTNKGLELLHRAPACRCGCCRCRCRYCLVYQTLHFRCFYKRSRSWSAGIALCLLARSAKISSSESGQEHESLSTDSSQLSPPPPSILPGRFL